MKAALSTLAISAGLLITANVVEAKPLLNKYCNSANFLTNAGQNSGKTYPHLHCEKRYIGYTPGKRSSTIDIMDMQGLDVEGAEKACADALEKQAGFLIEKIANMCAGENQDCNCPLPQQ